jgi:hypothetical protein
LFATEAKVTQAMAGQTRRQFTQRFTQTNPDSTPGIIVRIFGLPGNFFTAAQTFMSADGIGQQIFNLPIDAPQVLFGPLANLLEQLVRDSQRKGFFGG